MKQKKVTFKLYLNKKLTPQNEVYYPVYLRITYNRQTTQISDVLINHHTLYWSEEELDAFEKGFYSEKTREVAEMVKESLVFYEDIIRYEVEKKGEDYTIFGLSDKARFYRQSFRESFEDQLTYLKNIELCIMQNTELEDGSDSGFSKGIWNYMDKLSNSFKRMQELAILLDFYNMPSYNLELSNSLLSDSVYYWGIKGGVEDFEKFLDRYFGDKSGISEEYLKERFENDTPERRHLLPLLTALTPSKIFKNLYKDLLYRHLGTVLPQRG